MKTKMKLINTIMSDKSYDCLIMMLAPSDCSKSVITVLPDQR